MTRHIPVWLVTALLLVAPAHADIEADERALREAGIGTDGPALLRFFRSRTVSDADRAKVQELIKQLGDDSFAVRERASLALVQLGAVSEPLLKQAANEPDPEVKRRAQECLQRLSKASAPGPLASAARLLAARKPAGAVEALLAYVPAAPDESVTEAVHAALAALAVRDGKPEPALVAALADASPARRAAAAAALAGVADVRAEVRKLLDDAEAEVRLHAALALVFAKDREAIPELIDLLVDLPADRAARAEEVLLALAGEQAPDVGLGRDKAEREKARNAWAQWWKQNGAKADLAKLVAGEMSLGHTVVVQLDASGATGRVVEYGRDGKVRWEITGLKSPREAQLLSNGRVLICEYSNRRLTERDQKGRILWEHTVSGTSLLVSAQRLPNGNTFIVTRNQLTEIDREGKEVFSYKHNGSSIYAGRKQGNGEIVYLSLDGKCVRLDAKGNLVNSFNVGRPALVGIDVRPNGHVLIPFTTQNKVAEYDAKGTLVWEATVDRPLSAVRLPNGHVLVAGSVGQYVVELNRSGKEVWKLPIDGRPLRAYRR